MSVEFEVADADTVQVAADELKERGFTLLHDARTYRAVGTDGRSAAVKRGCDHRPLVRALDASVARRLHWHWGIGGVWAGLAGFIGARLIGMLARTARGRWAVTGPMARGA